MRNSLLRILLLTFSAALVSSCALSAAGLEPGVRPTAYTPKHLTGPDKGTKECPPCKYSAGPLIQLFINHESAENVQALTLKLETALATNEKFRGVVVITDETRKPEMEKWVADWKLQKTGLCYLSVGIRTTVMREYNLGDARSVLVLSNAKKVLKSFENCTTDQLEAGIKLLADSAK